MSDIPNGQASVLVTDKLLESYGITKEQLQKDALEMVQKNEPVTIKNMDEMIYEITEGSMGTLENPASPIWVATNKSQFHGASVIAYPDFMEQAAEKLNDSFYLLPSSTHEVLLIPDSYDLKAQELKEKVYKTDIPRSVRAEEISAEGASIFQHDPKGKVAEAYQVLTKEVLNNAEKRRKHQLEGIR